MQHFILKRKDGVSRWIKPFVEGLRQDGVIRPLAARGTAMSRSSSTLLVLSRMALAMHPDDNSPSLDLPARILTFRAFSASEGDRRKAHCRGNGRATPVLSGYASPLLDDLRHFHIFHRARKPRTIPIIEEDDSFDYLNT